MNPRLTTGVFIIAVSVRVANDLVWAGKATNIAVKLSDLGDRDHPMYISNRVYNRLNDAEKLRLDKKTAIWAKRYWTAKNNAIVYRSNYWREP